MGRGLNKSLYVGIKYYHCRVYDVPNPRHRICALRRIRKNITVPMIVFYKKANLVLAYAFFVNTSHSNRNNE